MMRQVRSEHSKPATNPGHMIKAYSKGTILEEENCLTKSAVFHIAVAKKLIKLNMENAAHAEFSEAGKLFVEEARNKLKKIYNASLLNEDNYKEYKAIIKIVESAATAFDLSQDKDNAKRYWKSASGMRLKLVLQTIDNSDGIKLKELERNALNAIKAAEKSEDSELIVTTENTIKNIFKLHKDNIVNADNNINDFLNAIRSN